MRQSAGIGRYARELLRALAALPGDDRYRVMYAARGSTVPLPDLGPRFDLFPIPFSDRVTNLMWQRLRLPVPIEMRTGRLDVFHSPDFSLAPSLGPSLVTVHDLAFEVVPHLSYPTLAIYLHIVVPRSIRRARAVVVPSSHTKDAIVRRLGTDPAKICVIPEGVSHNFGPLPGGRDEKVVHNRGLQRPYLLTVGTLEPRKNIERLLDAFAVLRERGKDLDLVIAGRPGWMYQGIFERSAQLGLGERVRFLQDVDDTELPALYRQSLLTVYPSIYEGFGLPALEALACGSPLAASGNSSIPEVAGARPCISIHGMWKT
jgi:glycosyltransferase involved in cell wall biosynthesis